MLLAGDDVGQQTRRRYGGLDLVLTEAFERGSCAENGTVVVRTASLLRLRSWFRRLYTDAGSLRRGLELGDFLFAFIGFPH